MTEHERRYRAELEQYVQLDRAAREMKDPAVREIADRKLNEHFENIQRLRAITQAESYRIRLGLGK